MATSTYMTFLMHKPAPSETITSPDWEKLLDITEFPDLGGDPEMIDVTTLSHRMRVYVPGVQDTEGLAFGANYDKNDYMALKALENKQEEYAVWFGGTENVGGGLPTPTGSEGKFSFTGQLSVHGNGGSVNEARGMTISIAPSTVISEE